MNYVLALFLPPPEAAAGAFYLLAGAPAVLWLDRQLSVRRGEREAATTTTAEATMIPTVTSRESEIGAESTK